MNATVAARKVYLLATLTNTVAQRILLSKQGTVKTIVPVRLTHETAVGIFQSHRGFTEYYSERVEDAAVLTAPAPAARRLRFLGFNIFLGFQKFERRLRILFERMGVRCFIHKTL